MDIKSYFVRVGTENQKVFEKLLDDLDIEYSYYFDYDGGMYSLKMDGEQALTLRLSSKTPIRIMKND